MTAVAATAFWGGVVRNQQVKAKEGTQTKIRAATSAYQQQKQDARNMNQAPDKNALDIARQQSVMRLQQGSGRASTFLSNGLGG
jgi:hypothetical protein